LLTRIVSTQRIHAGWARFSMVTAALDDGREIQREVEDHGRAVAVFPYDDQRRVALLARQERVPAIVAGCEASFLEAPAGLLEDDEDPEACARREALEECGVRLDALEPVVSGWSMPGVSTERISLFLARYGADDRVADGGGLAHEGEEIIVEEVPLAELARMADEGRFVDIKSLVLLLALRLRRPDLFQP
jgi:nudix-type nucleoside diphosphatase (YffH/AdpP family)